MTRVIPVVGLVSVLAVSACAVAPPSGPSVMALPPAGKTFDAFQQDDFSCRGYATQQTGGASAAQASRGSEVGSALLGTALGAGVGAALGSVGGAVGAGAAIGGATGLLAGSAFGAANAQAAGGNVQARYDTAYARCMYSRSNQVPGLGDAKQVPPDSYEDTMRASQLLKSGNPDLPFAAQGYNQVPVAQNVYPLPATNSPTLQPSKILASTYSRRVALVIGNGSYRRIGQLRNPANDAQLIGQVLTGLGYTLIGGVAQIDLDRQHFEHVVQEFGHSIPGASVAVFYYAGHGMQVDGTNWLVPVDAELTSRKQDLPFSLLSADNILLQMDGGGARLNLLILDACRNNPLGSRGFRDARGGLAEMHAPASSLIAYSTQPGNVALDGAGANSPYSLALAAAMQQADQDVFHVFNTAGLLVQKATSGAQVPWTSTSPLSNDARLGDR